MSNSSGVVSGELLGTKEERLAAVDKADRESIIVNDLYHIVQLPYGPMLLNRHDPSIVCCLQDQEQEIDLLCDFAVGNVADVGANVGGHTLGFARKATNVFAFEPQAQSYFTLCANLLLNNIQNVTPHQMALGDIDGVVNMVKVDPYGDARMMGWQVGYGDCPTRIHRLDTLNVSPLHFMKIDVEGFELEVLKGARETLIREPLILYIEIHHEWLVDEITSYLTALGYDGCGYIKNFYIDNPDLRTWGNLYWKPGRVTCVRVPS